MTGLPKTIRARIAVLTGGLALVVMLMLGAFLYGSLRFQLFRSVDDNLRIRASQLEQTVQERDGGLGFDPGAAGNLNLSDHDIAYLISPQGVILDRLSEEYAPAAVPEGGAEPGFFTARFANLEDLDEQDMDVFRFLTVPVERDDELLGYVQAGRDIESVDESLSSLLQLLLLAGPVLIGLAAGGGYWLTGRALAPIEQLRRQAATIQAVDLHQRLDVPPSADEVGRLAHTFNAMLARLEDSFLRQRRFTADASHELRTPLAIIRGETELALERPRAEAEYIETLQSVDAEAQRMSRLVNELLLLARADAGELRLSRERFDLAELLSLLVGQMQRQAREAGVTLEMDLSPVLPIFGDRDRLLELFINLIENALIYAPGSRVTVAAGLSEPEWIRVTVADRGPGIAAHHLPRLFERFYRVDPSRRRDGSGSGLGLAIAQEIARSHRGWIEVVSRVGEGSVFNVWLPQGEGEKG